MPGLNAQQTIPAGIPALIAAGQFPGQQAFLLDRLSVVIGEREGCDLQLLSGGVAPAHALIVTAIDGVYVRNLTGQADLLINGQPTVIHRLAEGDLLQVAQFTFRFWTNQAVFQPPMAPAPAAIECNGVWPIQARIPLIGRRPAIDLHLEEPSIAPVHAAIFTAGGVWHLRELSGQGDVLVNGAPIRQAELHGGDLVRIGNVQMRWLIGAAPQRPAAPKPALPALDSGLVLGGLPVSLPQIAPPAGFGRVGVTFEGQSLAARLAPRAPVPGPTLPDIAAIENASDSAPAEITVRTRVLRNFPPVPKLKPVDADEADERRSKATGPGGNTEEYYSSQGDFGVELSGGTEASSFYESAVTAAPVIGDSFGGVAVFPQPLAGDAVFGVETDGASAEYVPETSEPYAAEIDDFSENKFWDLTDEQQLDVPLPERTTDLTPVIPPTPVGEAGGIVADPIGSMPAAAGQTTPPGDVFGAMPTEPGAQSQAPQARSRAVRTLPEGAAYAAAPDESPSRYVRQTPSKVPVPAFAAAILAAMGGVGALVYLVVPQRSVVEGRLSFIHVPPDGTPDRQALVDNQRHRLTDPPTRDAAAAALAQNRPGLDAGFLGEAGQYDTVASSAHFENQGATGIDLVLRASGRESIGQSERMAELLDTLYQRDADLTAAAATAQGAISDWQPNIDAKQAEVDDSQQSIADQQALIAAAQKIAPTLADAQASAKDAQDQYIADQRTVIADEARLSVLTASLGAKAKAPVASKASASTQPAATQPSSDGAIADLQQQMQVLSDQIGTVQNAGSEEVTAYAHKRVLEVIDALTHDIAAGSDLLHDHPDLQISVSGARALNQRIGDLADQMAKQRQRTRQYEDLGRLIERAARLRAQAIFDADAQLIQLNSDLDAARTQFDEAISPNSNAADDVRVAAQTNLEKLQQQVLARRRALTPHRAGTLSQHVDRLIAAGRRQSEDAQQVVAVTAQTLAAQLETTPPIGGLTDAQRDLGMRIVQGLLVLARAQTDYTACIAAEGGSSAQLLLSLQDQLAELKDQADARGAVLNAAPPAGDDQRQQPTAERDALAAKIPGEIKTMESDAAAFFYNTLAAVDTDLQVLAGDDAQRTLPALTAARDAKLGDLAAMKQSRDRLQAAADATVDVKHPAAADNVRVISDTSDLRTNLSAAAALITGGLLSLAAWRMRHPAPISVPTAEPALQA